MKLIDKDKVISILKDKIADIELDMKCGFLKKRKGANNILILEYIIYLIDTLEVKEVDLEKSISDWLFEGLPNDEEEIDYIKETAKHFFKLGLSVAQPHITIPNIDDILEEGGIDPNSKVAKIFKESYYKALDNNIT